MEPQNISMDSYADIDRSSKPRSFITGESIHFDYQEDVHGGNTKKKKKKKKKKRKEKHSDTEVSEEVPKKMQANLLNTEDDYPTHRVIRQGDNGEVIVEGMDEKQSRLPESALDIFDRAVELGDELYQAAKDNIKKFWDGLTFEEKKEVIMFDKETFIKSFKNETKNSCTCSVCGKKREYVEKEVEHLYKVFEDEMACGFLLLDTPPLEKLSFDKLLQDDVPELILKLRAPPLIHNPKPTPKEQKIIPEELVNSQADMSMIDEMPMEKIFNELSPENIRATLKALEDPAFAELVKGESPSELVKKWLSVQERNGLASIADDLLQNDGQKFLNVIEKITDYKLIKSNLSILLRQMRYHQERIKGKLLNQQDYDEYEIEDVENDDMEADVDLEDETEDVCLEDERDYEDDDEDENDDDDDDDDEDDEAYANREYENHHHHQDGVCAEDSHGHRHHNHHHDHGHDDDEGHHHHHHHHDHGYDSEEYEDDESQSDFGDEGRKLLHLITTRLIQKKLFTAYKTKVAEEKAKEFLEELDKEEEKERLKEEKKRRDKEKKRDKKKKQQQLKEQERLKKEKAKEEAERLVREEQLRKTELGRKRKEEERKKRDTEKQKQKEKKRQKELELAKQKEMKQKEMSQFEHIVDELELESVKPDHGKKLLSPLTDETLEPVLNTNVPPGLSSSYLDSKKPIGMSINDPAIAAIGNKAVSPLGSNSTSTTTPDVHHAPHDIPSVAALNLGNTPNMNSQLLSSSTSPVFSNLPLSLSVSNATQPQDHIAWDSAGVSNTYPSKNWFAPFLEKLTQATQFYRNEPAKEPVLNANSIIGGVESSIDKRLWGDLNTASFVNTPNLWSGPNNGGYLGNTIWNNGAVNSTGLYLPMPNLETLIQDSIYCAYVSLGGNRPDKRYVLCQDLFQTTRKVLPGHITLTLSDFISQCTSPATGTRFLFETLTDSYGVVGHIKITNIEDSTPMKPGGGAMTSGNHDPPQLTNMNPQHTQHQQSWPSFEF